MRDIASLFLLDVSENSLIKKKNISPCKNKNLAEVPGKDTSVEVFPVDVEIC